MLLILKTVAFLLLNLVQLFTLLRNSSYIARRAWGRA